LFLNDTDIFLQGYFIGILKQYRKNGKAATSSSSSSSSVGHASQQPMSRMPFQYVNPPPSSYLYSPPFGAVFPSQYGSFLPYNYVLQVKK